LPLGRRPHSGYVKGVNLEAFGELAIVESDDDNPYKASPSVKTPKPVATPNAVPPGFRVRETRNLMEIYHSKNTIEYVIEGLLPTKGLMYIGARSGTGKTILAIQLVIDILLERDTMTLKRSKDLKPQKILILSMEMGGEELQARLLSMYPNLTEEEQKIIAEGTEAYTGAESFKFWEPTHAAELTMMIRKLGITGVIIDSASVTFASSLKDDSQVNAAIENLYVIRNMLGVWMIVICHTRKLPAGIVGNMEDVTVDEIFGHSGVAQSASAILLMHHEKKAKEAKDGKYKVVWLMNLKARFFSEFPPFVMLLPTEGALLFKRRTPIPLPGLTPEQRRAANKAARNTDFGEVFKVVDFGSIPGGDDDS
jgi:archaellum biogenesis ATPase FlaH